MSQDPPPTDAEHRQRLHEILADAGTVMMITRHGEELRMRPMAVAKVADDDTLYFSTSTRTDKLGEIERDDRVDLVFQSRTRYAAVAGEATLSRDRALIDELWQDSWRVWFPEGKDDPSIVIVVVRPSRGAYWDLGGAGGLKFLYRSAKALVTRSEVEVDPESHGEVAMGASRAV